MLPSLSPKLTLLPPCPVAVLTHFPHWPHVSKHSSEKLGSQILVSAEPELCVTVHTCLSAILMSLLRVVP